MGAHAEYSSGGLNLRPARWSCFGLADTSLDRRLVALEVSRWNHSFQDNEERAREKRQGNLKIES